jgi:hypothetical protein
MFRVIRDDLIDDADTIDGVREIVGQQPPGRYRVDEISVDPLPSGHTARRWGVAIKRPDRTQRRTSATERMPWNYLKSESSGSWSPSP